MLIKRCNLTIAASRSADRKRRTLIVTWGGGRRTLAYAVALTLSEHGLCFVTSGTTAFRFALPWSR